MTTAQMLVKIKDSMRISHSALDDTLTDDINAGALELKRSGVSVFDQGLIRDDELIVNAIRFFVMAAEDYNGKAEQYTQAFERLRNALSLSDGYRAESNDEG